MPFSFDTLAVRAGQTRSAEGEHSEALFLTSSYVFKNAAEAAARFAGQEAGNVYSRYTNPTVRIRDSIVRVCPAMKYLGVFLDYRLNFKAHFQYLDTKVAKVTRALCRLMPNLRGPLEKKRRLYAGILEAVVLYAAPIWAGSLNYDARCLFRRWQRSMAVRVCCAYRSVSFDSATLLARLIPLELLATERDRIFRRIMDARREGLNLENIIGNIKIQERIITQRQWILLMSRSGAAGVKLRDAMLPCLPAFIKRFLLKRFYQYV